MSNNRKKQALCIASVASNLDNFNRNNIDILQELGYEITLAANFHSKEDNNSQEEIVSFAKKMRAKGVHIVHIDFSRSPKKVGMQIKSIWQVRKLLKRRFDLIHCHTPICAAIVRAEAQKYRKKYGTKVFYTAHGFHFFTGAPLKNWMIFYPIEKMMSKYTDVLITINQEDYKRACKKFMAKKIVHIPGVGVNIEKLQKALEKRAEKRKELGVADEDIVFLSVGELNANKNHELAIKALAQMKIEGYNMSHIKYFICGIGKLENYLQDVIIKLGLDNTIKLLGYRKDVAEIYGASNIFLFTSKREGLSLALMEAMASGLPCVVSNIRGNRDLIDEAGGILVQSNSVKLWSEAIVKILKNSENMGKHNVDKIKNFSIEKVNNNLEGIYLQ